MNHQNVSWYHGTNSHFSSWVFPPPQAREKPELFVHTISFLTTDKELANAAGGRLCTAAIAAQANVLNIFEDKSDSEELRRRVANTELGRYHDYAINATYWQSAWRQGLMMRYGSNHPDRKPVLEEMQRFAQAANRGSRDPKHIQAWIEAQNLTRKWVELLGVEARNMGFDALIGCEIFSSSALGGRPCPVLFALTGKSLTPPIWVK